MPAKTGNIPVLLIWWLIARFRMIAVAAAVVAILIIYCSVFFMLFCIVFFSLCCFVLFSLCYFALLL